MAIRPTITSPTDSAFDELCKELSSRADQVGALEAWPADSLASCAHFGVHQWFFPLPMGGQDWSESDILRGYLRLSAACLTTTFVLTQWQGACRRIATSENDRIAATLIPDLISGKTFATVGISHLTTSRRHLGRPALSAEPIADGFLLDGFSPWVTGALHAQTIVTGATLADGRQILIAVPTDLPGVEVGEPLHLVGLTGSQTGPVRFHQVSVDNYFLLAGPVENVMAQGVGAKTGGLQTSCLALGLATTALGYLNQQASFRPELEEAASSLGEEHARLVADMFAICEGQPSCTNEELRARANSLVLRATQATLAAAKGTGYVHGHPAGRWCREALFFLVWSCPQPVLAANLCELAGLTDE